MADSKVKVIDAGGIERYVRPVDAAEIVAGGGSYDLEAMKDEKAREQTQIIEGVTTGRQDSIPHTPISPDSAREAIDYNLESGDGMPGGKVNVDAKAAGVAATEINAAKDANAAETLESLSAKSRTDLEKQAKALKIDGTAFPNKATLAEAVFKAQK